MSSLQLVGLVTIGRITDMYGDIIQGLYPYCQDFRALIDGYGVRSFEHHMILYIYGRMSRHTGHLPRYYLSICVLYVLKCTMKAYFWYHPCIVTV